MTSLWNGCCCYSSSTTTSCTVPVVITTIIHLLLPLWYCAQPVCYHLALSPVNGLAEEPFTGWSCRWLQWMGDDLYCESESGELGHGSLIPRNVNYIITINNSWQRVGDLLLSDCDFYLPPTHFTQYSILLGCVGIDKKILNGAIKWYINHPKNTITQWNMSCRLLLSWHRRSSSLAFIRRRIESAWIQEW